MRVTLIDVDHSTVCKFNFVINFCLAGYAQVDKDASGTVELEEVQSALPQTPPDQVAQMFAEADRNKDGHLDRMEYSGFVSCVC